MTCNPELNKKLCPICGRIRTPRHETFFSKEGTTPKKIICIDYESEAVADERGLNVNETKITYEKVLKC